MAQITLIIYGCFLVVIAYCVFSGHKTIGSVLYFVVCLWTLLVVNLGRVIVYDVEKTLRLLQQSRAYRESFGDIVSLTFGLASSVYVHGLLTLTFLSNYEGTKADVVLIILSVICIVYTLLLQYYRRRFQDVRDIYEI